jgi:hypothetical protein
MARSDPRRELPSRTFLLNDPETFVALHHILDLVEDVLVARSDSKPFRIRPDTCAAAR